MSLRLTDASLYEKFWEFTNEEVVITMPYFIFLAGTFLLMNILLGENIGFVAVVALVFLLYILVHMIGKRYRRFYAYGMLTVFFAEMAQVCIGLIFFQDYEDQQKQDLALRAGYQYLANIALFFCMCAVPSTKWLLFYILVQIMAIVLLTYKLANF